MPDPCPGFIPGMFVRTRHAITGIAIVDVRSWLYIQACLFLYGTLEFCVLLPFSISISRAQVARRGRACYV